MSVDARKEEFEHVELFGKSALFTDSRISRFTVPQGWFCYDLRGSDYDPGRPIMVENKVAVNHAGSILTPTDLKLNQQEDHRISIKNGLNFLGECLTLEQFCEEHGLEYPAENRKYVPRPASPSEAGLFYALKPELDKLLGGIGHLRMDFGRNGEEFWTSWFDHGSGDLNSQEFKKEIDEVVNELRQTVLRDRAAMRSYCAESGGELGESLGIRQHGYVVETENYRYCLRCKPQEGDYDGYLWCFDKRVQEMNQAQKKEEIQNINEQIRPFDIQMRALGDYYLALRFSFFEGPDAEYGQDAFDAYAVSKGESPVNEYGLHIHGNGYEWDEVFKYAFKDTPGYEKLTFDSEAGCFFCDCDDLDLLKTCAMTMKQLCESNHFAELVQNALDQSSRQNAESQESGEKMQFCGKTVERIAVSSYRSSPVCMALELKSGEGSDVITVNLGSDIGNGTIMPRGCAFIDVNNYPELPSFIEENGLGEPYTRFGSPVTMQSGFVEYPLYRFNENSLKEFDESGYAAYAEDYAGAFLKEQAAMNSNMFGMGGISLG